MKNQVLSIEQMKHLKELGVDASEASMCWVQEPDRGKYALTEHGRFCYEMGCLQPFPTFTLHDMLKCMPKIIYEKSTQKYANLNLEFTKDKVGICYLVGSYIMFKDYRATGKTILEAVYNMLCWLAENNLLGKEKRNE